MINFDLFRRIPVKDAVLPIAQIVCSLIAVACVAGCGKPVPHTYDGLFSQSNGLFSGNPNGYQCFASEGRGFIFFATGTTIIVSCALLLLRNGESLSERSPWNKLPWHRIPTHRIPWDIVQILATGVITVLMLVSLYIAIMIGSKNLGFKSHYDILVKKYLDKTPPNVVIGDRILIKTIDVMGAASFFLFCCLASSSLHFALQVRHVLIERLGHQNANEDRA